MPGPQSQSDPALLHLLSTVAAYQSTDAVRKWFSSRKGVTIDTRFSVRVVVVAVVVFVLCADVVGPGWIRPP